MKSNKIMSSASKALHRVGFQLQKKSPEILVGVGILGAVVSTVLACKATTKAGKVIDEAKKSIDTIHQANERGVTNAGESYSDQDCKKDLTVTYAQTGIKLAKLYGPAVVLGVASAASILASHNIMKKRNVAIAAAYAAVDKSFKDYRGLVLERFGEQVEKELRYGIKAKEIEETVTDSKGKEKTVKKTVDVAEAGWDPSKYSPYAKVFDEGHRDWRKDPEQNMFFLKALQAQANDMLKSRGHLFLNEVYDLLGFKRTTAGASVGWIYDERNPVGDNFIDFGLFEVRRPAVADFVNGYERSIILDFNVVGDITTMIPDH
ncbi:DUF6353 family protein, partial [Oscillibacter sp. CU971]|uniref:DUF6353 family protein n=1 Tax=Oscillibacter sp. CU971 TaxID=2780102 RepID=UPI00195EDEA1